MPNIYVWSAAEGTRFVAVAAWPGLSRVSRNGRYAVIETASTIGGATNAGHMAIYEYDDLAGQVACVSCRPDGSPSTGNAAIRSTPAFGYTEYMAPRSIADGGQVYFSSTDRIVSADHTTAADVYEYEFGAVSLLTAGRGDNDSYLADSSDDGSDVFVLSRSPFVPEDRDLEELDLYDLRVGGGFLYVETPVAEPCVGDECQGQPVAAPAVPRIGSLGSANARRRSSVADAAGLKAKEGRRHEHAPGGQGRRRRDPRPAGPRPEGRLCRRAKGRRLPIDCGADRRRPAPPCQEAHVHDHGCRPLPRSWRQMRSASVRLTFRAAASKGAGDGSRRS